MYNLFEYDLKSLFKVRDACVILMGFNFTLVKDLLYEINKELCEREKPIPPDDPDKERI